MIVYDDFVLDGKLYKYIHSDNKKKLQRDDGEIVSESLEKPGEHTYIETDEDIGEVQDYEKAMRILLGVEK